MALCFEEKLGYSLYEVKDLSILHLEKLLNDLGNIQIPSTCNKDFRFFFFFFGHGTANEICLSDGNIEKSVIISQLQKIHKDKFKIVFFDSCQTVPQDESSSVPDSVPSLCDLEVTIYGEANSSSGELTWAFTMCGCNATSFCKNAKMCHLASRNRGTLSSCHNLALSRPQ